MDAQQSCQQREQENGVDKEVRTTEDAQAPSQAQQVRQKMRGERVNIRETGDGPTSDISSRRDEDALKTSQASNPSTLFSDLTIAFCHFASIWPDHDTQDAVCFLSL